MGATVEYRGLAGLTLEINLETGMTSIKLNGILKWIHEKTVSEIMSIQRDLYTINGEKKETIVTMVIADLLNGEVITA